MVSESVFPSERTAVLTGAASERGIGRATVMRLAEQGWSVAIHDDAAREMGEHHITVNAVAPGPIDTDIMGGALTDDRKAAMSTDILVGRVGTPDDVASLIAFLLSEQAGFITAATYDINGGLQIS